MHEHAFPTSAAQATPLVLRATFLHDPSHDATFLRAVVDEHPEYALLRRREGVYAWLIALLAVATLAIPLYFIIRNSIFDRTAHIMPWIIVICVYPLIGMYFASQTPWRKHYRNSVSPKLYPQEVSVVSYEADHVEVEVTTRGVRWRTSEYGQEWSWKYFEDVRLFEGHITFAIAGDLSALIVPAGAFSTEVSKQEFLDGSRALLEESGYSLVARMRFAAPKNSQLVCPRCRYSLSNLTSDRCPECSRVLTGFAIQCGTWLELPWYRWFSAAFFRR